MRWSKARRVGVLYARMAALTLEVCAKTCRDLRPNRCCDPEYCDMAIENAKVNGVTLATTGHPTLPLMDPTTNTCTAPPHLRPLCAAHQCDINALGLFKPREGVISAQEAARLTDLYFKIRGRAGTDYLGE